MSDIQADQPQVEAGESVQQEEAPQQASNTTPEWVPKRMSEMAAARRAAEQREQDATRKLMEAEAELARLRAGGDPSAQPAQPGLSQQDIDRMISERADRVANERTTQQQFASRLAEIEQSGKKEFGADYDSAIANLNTAGVGGQDFVRVLSNVPGAEKVVTWLGKNENVGEAIRIASLDPVQMGIELMKLSPKAAKELGKQVSKAPAPVGSVDGGGNSSTGSEPSVGTKEWFDWRNKNARKKR